MKRTLEIAPRLSLPPEAVTQTFALLAMRGAGKSNAAVVMAEEMYDAGLHWVAIDPKGDWYGLRSSRDGKGPGLPIPIFGGQHGDIPLEPGAGAYIADLIIDHTLTCVLDLSEFTEADKIRFLAGDAHRDGFAARFYRRKSPQQPATHIFLEEADDYLPQKVDGRKAKLLHDCSRLLLWGRQRGIGGTAITQRSARLHKDVLTQTENLLVMRTTAPQDQKAVHEWVKYHGVAEKLMESLSSLENGEAWLWSPHWLKMAERIRFRQRRTFDSGATPVTGGMKQAKPATLADVDIEAVRVKMAETIERVKADDPKELRRKIAEQAKRIEELSAPVSAPAAKVDPERLQKEFERGARSVKGELGKQIRSYEREVTAKLSGARDAINKAMAALGETDPVFLGLDEIIAEAGKCILLPMPTPITADVSARMPMTTLPAREPRKVETLDGSFTLAKLHRAILTVLAQHPEGLSKGLILLHSGYRASGDVSVAFAAMGRYGLVESAGTGLRITKGGLDALGEYDPLPIGKALRQWLLSGDKLTKVEKALLQVICDARCPVPKGEIVRLAGYKPSGDVSVAFARLVRFGYAKSVPGGLQMAKELGD